jgi:hypothetical protein
MEKRKLERFELHAPVRLLLETAGNREEEYELTTRDLSSGGAFLYSPQPIPEGAKARMEILISLDTIQKLMGENGWARVRVKGQVIRSDSNGVAIRFESSYKITALETN